MNASVEKLLEYARCNVDLGAFADGNTPETLPRWVVYVVVTSESQEPYIINNNNWEPTVEQMKSANDTLVTAMVALFENGAVDVPSIMFRKALVELNEQNIHANVVLQTQDGYVMKSLENLMPPKQDVLNVVFEWPTKNSMLQIFSDVVVMPYALDFGPIDNSLFSEERLQQMWELRDPYVDKEELARFFEDCEKELAVLKDAALSGKPIRIFKGKFSDSLCAFAFVCDFLRDIDCPISVCELPFWANSWAFLTIDNIVECAKREDTVMTTELKEMYSNLWRRLVAENAPLRAFINDRLVSVEDDFYDDMILSTIPNGEHDLGYLFGQWFDKYGSQLIDPGLYRYRLREMARNGRIKMIDEDGNKDDFKTVVKRMD
ncbi:MAG: DUF1835 domain-containing protein [Clostridia bacterium]|nr:DUF1835 domain-containing protein [Clostridia bacterium]